MKVLDNFPYKVALLTSDLRIAWINEELERTLDRDVIGQKSYEVYQDNLDRCRKCPLSKEISSGETKGAICEGALGDRELDLTHRGVEIGGEKFVLEIWQDVTEEREAKRELSRLASFPEKTPIPILEWGKDLQLVYLNPAAREYSRGGESGRHPLAPEDLNEIFESLKAGDVQLEYRELEYKDRIFTEYIYYLPERESVRVYAYDVTRRKEVEARFKRSKRDLALLSRCNQLLVRTSTERELLEDICETLVRVGGYDLAWVGCPEYDGQKSVEIAAISGCGSGFLEDLNISWGKGRPGREPTGRAIMSGDVVISSIDVDDSNKLPWEEEAKSRGISGVASFPLESKDELYGALTVYYSETQVLDKRENELLLELADDLAFGIEALREQERRKSLQKELKKLSSHLFRAREDEREQISRELHDELGQLTTSIIIALSGLRNRKSISEDPETLDKLEKITDISETLDQKLRNMATDIRPPSLKELGLVPTVKSYIDEVRKNQGLNIDLKADNVESVLGSGAQVHLYRIIQEAVTNSVRHGDPDFITIKMEKHGDRVMVTVSDDGTGFDKEEVQEENGVKKSLGLISMRERVRSLSGSLSIESSPEEGTELTVKVPLDYRDELD